MHTPIRNPGLRQFLLVPDGSAARRVRRLIAQRGACSGVLVGSWPELLAYARCAYLVPEPVDDRGAAFGQALSERKDAFWSKSLSVAPAETGAAVSAALARILSATDPARRVEDYALERLPRRPRRHLSDLFRLSKVLAGRLPGDLSPLQNLLSAKASEALYPIRVHHREGAPFLTRWQGALVEKLNRDAASKCGAGSGEEALGEVLRVALAGDPANQKPSALGLLQSRLFSLTDEQAELDDSVQWVGVRDFLQEAEVAVGMVQTLLAERPDLKPADVGLLVPDSSSYALAVQDAFRLGGLALAGLPPEAWRRDLGREAVLHFIHCRQKPAPAMALAACLCSPLMPWSREEGSVLARAVMDGDYQLRPPPAARVNARAMLELLRGGDAQPATLVQALERFGALLGSGERFADQVQQARTAAAQTCAVLRDARVIDWHGLRRAVSPRVMGRDEAPDFNLEGVTIWREAHEPWRAVRHLLVLGFAQGHYPLPVRDDAVFSGEDIQTMRERLGLALSTPAEGLARRRQRLRRQLAAVAESVTFLIPRRDPSGAAQAPSESLVFMHPLFVGPRSAEALVVELEAVADRPRARHLASAPPCPPRPPRPLFAGDMRFDRDLLALRADAQGQLKPESPSSLETLMVSPLAWLLRRLHAEPNLWEPESADVGLLGTLAHKVFEDLFQPGEKLPLRDELPGKVEAALGEAASRLAPFLMASQWQVERRYFVTETAKAAQAWRDVLAQLGAEVLASEVWLQGTWSGIPIHGQADLILGLGGERLLVVDYKRSKSSNRRQRMDKGYDSQASLYRAMLQSGEPRGHASGALRARIRSLRWTGIVYYMLNDQVSLSDAVLPGSAAIPGWQALETDVAGRAMALIQRRLGEVRQGLLCLNRDGDTAFFEKQAGLKPYALQASPLIGLFTLPGESGVGQ